jgi:hypothetical protein
MTHTSETLQIIYNYFAVIGAPFIKVLLQLSGGYLCAPHQSVLYNYVAVIGAPLHQSVIYSYVAVTGAPFFKVLFTVMLWLLVRPSSKGL